MHDDGLAAVAGYSWPDRASRKTLAFVINVLAGHPNSDMRPLLSAGEQGPASDSAAASGDWNAVP